jgi:lactonase
MLKKTKRLCFSTSVIAVIICMAFVIFANLGLAAEEWLPALVYKGESKSAVPILGNEEAIQTITAKKWLKISDKPLQLEGLIFDRDHNLLVLDVFGGEIFKVLMPHKKVIRIVGPNNLSPGAVKIHKDGRLFVAGLGDFVSKGSVTVMNPHGTDWKTIIPESAGYLVDDLVFDKKGGFYFTDFKGYSTNPIGGVYYVSPDFKTITPILKNIAIANGIALSKDERTLWVTEIGNNRLHKVELEEDGVTIAAFGASVPYYFNGYLGPDSAMIDDDDNLYVAIYNQGKVMVFNKLGNAIGQILIPGRETGHMLRTTASAIIPGTKKIIICANDGDRPDTQGAWLYIAETFAKSWDGAYQFK